LTCHMILTKWLITCVASACE